MKFDLGSLKNKTLDLTLLDKQVISIKKPGKVFLVELEDYKLKTLSMGIGEVFDLLEEIVLKILNNNTEGKVFDVKYLEETKLDYTVQSVIFNKYFEFVQDALYNPN